MTNKLQELVDKEKTTIIGGDFNVCALTQRDNLLTARLTAIGFKQLVTQATHTDGKALDHVYVRQGRKRRFDWALELMPKYYSDHEGIGLTLWESHVE